MSGALTKKDLVWLAPIVLATLMFAAVAVYKPRKLQIAHELCKNCVFLYDTISVYRRAKGAFPGQVKDLQIQSPPFQNPIARSKPWLVEKLVNNLDEASEFSKHALPGQIVFCPLKSNGKIVDFFVAAIDEDGLLLQGAGGDPLIFRKDGQVRSPRIPEK